MPRVVALLTSLVLACSAGEDASQSTGSPGTATTEPASTTAPTTGEGTTGDASTSTTDAASTTTTTGATTTTDTTATTGPVCDPGALNCVCDAGACAEGLECVADVCVPEAVCDDPDEPDDDEPSAHDLGEISDDDDDALTVEGVLGGPDDVDWFTYHGLDTFGHYVEPTVKLTASGDVRVCQFIECDAGGVAATDVTCPVGTDLALSGVLRPGCCGSATFTISELACEGTSDDMRVYVRLDEPDDVCVDYTLVVHY